ncbi:Hsp70 family protein [Candidatus Spongiihabitans sp.]|uniref:Hsp70 family protein n=1 Tax=Candidatus Spongiihabitans sp. TaxID=3101308 RepID=UPI003C6ED37A
MYLGIDLGTSNSAIVAHLDGKLHIVKTVDQGTDVLPSVIHINRSGTKFYGHRAYQQLCRNPANATDGFKRQMGTSWKKEFADAGVVMNAEQCSAEILRQLIAQARVAYGDCDIVGAVITTPAAFNQMQIEATYRAAGMAGLGQIALLQEPVAAAMASVADNKNKDGLFLVYDIGGGTFDLALVQSTKGNINILAHEGINALGGRDFDRIIINGIVRPWLLENYALAADFQKNPKYEKMIRVARMAAEVAKVELSKSESATIYMSEDDLRVTDDDGADIFIEIPIDRKQFEELIVDKVDETVDLSQKILKDNGYESGDLDRLVFIGGPTKMPTLRERVSHKLVLPADMSIDPMTAVAVGAAIFCEGLDWTDQKKPRKKTLGRTMTEGEVKLQYDYISRTAEDRARIRIKPQDDSASDGVEIQIDSSKGWTSGRRSLDSGTTIELPLDSDGENHFRIMAFDQNGSLIKDAGREIVINRVAASAGSLRLTHNLAVMIVSGEGDEAENTLHIFAEKGIALPDSGVFENYRMARDVRDGDDSLLVEFFQQPEAINPTPDEPNLFIGSCEIRREKIDFDICKGDDLNIHWDVDESGVMRFKVELVGSGEISNELRFTESVIDYEGEGGERFVGGMVNEAKKELATAEKISTASDSPGIRKIKNSLDQQSANLQNVAEGEERRSIAEKIRELRQKIAAIRNDPQNRIANLKSDLQETEESFNENCREQADEQTCQRFDTLARQAHDELKSGDIGYGDAKRSVNEMHNIYERELWSDPGFIVAMFKRVSKEKHTAVNAEKHDQLVETGKEMLNDNDIDGLGRVTSELFANQIHSGGSELPIDRSTLSPIMRR